jgi:dCMP deaminase
MNWNEYNMGIAKAASNGSKDPSTKVGCYIVDATNSPVSTGFNGMISEADESFFTWERPMKYLYVIHAEHNALLFSKRDLAGCKAYVTQAPCESCLKLMLQAKIREIYYDDCSIMRDRSTADQKTAIKAMIEATGAMVHNLNGTSYLKELQLD